MGAASSRWKLVNIFALMACSWLHAAPALRADFPAPTATKTSRPYPCVEMAMLTFAEPRPLRVWTVKIDLTSPDIDFVVTPRAPLVKEKLETIAVTTLDFAKEFHTQVSINGACFLPVPKKAGETVDIVGLSISLGDRYSQAEPKNGALVFDANRQASILHAPIMTEHLRGAIHGVGGHFNNGVLLAAGKNLFMHEIQPGANAPIHPRTAAGLSADKKTMWWIIVDGRQKQTSEGLTLGELAELGRRIGCADLLNLDGGGSTTLVLQDREAKAWNVLNTPVGLGKPDTLRWNGNNLGLYVFTADRAVTAAQLKAIMPNLGQEKMALFLGPLNRAMWKYDITTPKRRAAFLAQLAHESGELRYLQEIASGKDYEGRKDLGNTEPGDGPRYKGRGPMQITGRYNYRTAGKALGQELEQYPELAARPDIGCLVAGWYWQSRKLNDLADQGEFQQITRRINGGLNGLKQRELYYRKALEVFGSP